jgi:hypothetical protein
MRSSLIVAVICKGVHIAAQSAFKHVLGLDLHSFGALADLVSDLRAVVTDVVLRVVLRELFEELLGALEVLLDEDLGVVVRALGTFLAESVHVVPA